MRGSFDLGKSLTLNYSIKEFGRPGARQINSLPRIVKQEVTDSQNNNVNYPTDFKLGTRYSLAERVIRNYETIMVREYGSDYWLLKSLNNVSKFYPLDLEPQMLEQIGGFMRDRINEASGNKLSTLESAAEGIDAIKDYLSYKGTDPNSLGENFLCRLEDLVAFIIAVSSSTTLPAALSIIHLYVRTHYHRAVTQHLMGEIMKIFGVSEESVKITDEKLELETQSEEVNLAEFSLGSMKSLLSNWKELKTSVFASKLGNLTSIMIAYGFLNPSEQLSDKLLQVFNKRSWEVQKDSVDFAEMLLDTATFFLERGYAAFVSGDLSLLLYSDNDIANLDKEFALLSGALPLLETGNLSGLDDYSESIKDQSEYEVRLQKLNATYASMLKVEKSPQMRNVLTNRLVVLSKVRTSLILCQKSSCIRTKPFGLLIYGGSSVGKTTINAYATKVCLHHNGYSSGKENIITLNDNDKYQSEYKAHHMAVTMDDFGNTCADKYDGSPTAKIIDFLNNVPKAALNANADLKGNIMIQPKVVSVTTNVKHLMASSFSNEPVSILRRFELIFDVKIRPEFTDKKTKGLDRTKMLGFMPDAWLIDVQYVEIIREDDENAADRYNFVDIKKGASIYEALEILKQKSEEHFGFQKSYVANIEEMYDTEFCCHSCFPTECRLCADALQETKEYFLGLEEQSDEEKFVVKQWDPLEELSDFKDIEIQSEETLQQFVKKSNYVDRAYKIACDTLALARKEKVKILKIAACAAIGIPVAIFSARSVLKLFRALVPQGSALGVPQKLDTDVESPWKRVVHVPVPVSTASETTTVDTLTNLVSRSMGHLYIYNMEKTVRRRCNIIPLQGNYWLAPSHMFEDQEYEIEIQTTPMGILGKNPTQLIGPEIWYRIPNTDFIVLSLTSGGDVPNLARFLPTSEYIMSGTHCITLYKDPEGEVTRHQVKIDLDRHVATPKQNFDGFQYTYAEKTFRGLCMMTHVARKVKPFIAGFHLAGYVDTTLGIAGKLYQSQVLEAVNELRSRRVLETHSSGTMPTEKYGIDYKPNGETPQSSAVNWLVDEDGYQPIGEVYGPHPLGTRTFKSQVRKSVISDSVTEIMGLPKLHGKPKGMNSWVHWQRDLSLMSHPTGKFRPIILKRARDDMNAMVDEIFEQKPEMLDLIHPYSHEVILAGADGINSVDRVDLSTSMGFPINKQKSNFVRESEIKIDGISCPLEMDDQFWKELDRMETVLAHGERIHTIFRGNLKDEATKLTKDKVRVFAGCEFAFTLLVRKYYLSIIRVIQTNWDDFECAVGINAHGPEWTRLTKKLTKYSTTRMIAGDYAAYDKRVCPEATLSAFDVMIRMAEKAGYTARQLTIMRGIATEICLPIYEYNGVFVKVFGSNPSGHPLTVIINNLQNSIYLRYAYYALYENEQVPLFHNRVALICYGDDNAMSVHEDDKKFNHTAISNELAKVGIKYTMADKEAESVPFITLEETSFLKRGFVYNEILGNWVAPIEEASIVKSLHNYMSRRGSTALPEEIAGDAIKSAAREYFFHGKDVYELRKEQLEQIRDIHGLVTFVGELPSYQDMIDGYLGKKLKAVDIADPGILMLH